MFRRRMQCGLGALALFALIGGVAAQEPVPPSPPKFQFPKMEGVPPELQKEIERLFDEAAKQQEPPAAQREFERFRGRGDRDGGPSLRWGGLRLSNVNQTLQEKLGLPENEGLLVSEIDPGSVADKAGLKVNDVLVKINNKAVPSDANGLTKLVEDQKAEIDLVVVRDGKEETIKGTKMPASVQSGNRFGDFGRGRGGRNGFPGIGEKFIPRLPGRGDRNPIFPVPMPQPFQQQGKLANLDIRIAVNGANVLRKQINDQFFGEYSKDDLKISLNGKFEDGLAKVSEISVQHGKDTKKYTTLAEVPGPERIIIIQQALIPMAPNILMPLFPGLDR